MLTSLHATNESMSTMWQVSVTDLSRQVLESSRDLQARNDKQLELILTSLNPKFDRLESQVKDLGTQISNVQKDLSKVEKDLGTQISNVEKDLGTQISKVEEDLGTQISKVEKDLGTQISNVQKDISKVEKDLGTQISKVEKDVTFIRAVGTVVVVLLTLAIKIPSSVWEKLFSIEP
jgi:chromosome segregation ATPase